MSMVKHNNWVMGRVLASKKPSFEGF